MRFVFVFEFWIFRLDLRILNIRKAPRFWLLTLWSVNRAAEYKASLTVFKRVWKKCFGHVKVPKNKRFSKCVDCTTTAHILNNLDDPAARALAASRAKRNTTIA